MITTNRTYCNREGFTIIEILVAVSLVAILTTIAATIFNSAQMNNRDQKKLRDLNTIKQALEMYRSDNSSYPAALSTLVPKYIDSTSNYQYQTSSGTFILCARAEGSGSFTLPSGCSALTCEGSACSMGLSSD